MKKYSLLFIAVFLCALNGCNSNSDNSLTINSSDKSIGVTFFLNKENQAGYKIDFKDKTVIDSSFFSFGFSGKYDLVFLCVLSVLVVNKKREKLLLKHSEH